MFPQRGSCGAVCLGDAGEGGVYPGYGTGWVVGRAIPVPRPSHPWDPYLTLFSLKALPMAK